MSLNDPIGDMIARMKNSQLRNHKIVELPSSSFKVKIAEVLKNEVLNWYKVSSDDKKPLEIELKYNYGSPVISSIERVLKPGRRIFQCRSSRLITAWNSNSIDTKGVMSILMLERTK